MSSLTGSTLDNTSTNQTNTASNTAGTSTTSPTFSPALQALMNSLSGYSTQSMNNPSAQLQPIQNAGLDQINQQFNTAPQVAATQLASRGYGSSGALGNTLYQTANAKASAQSAFNGQLAQDAVQQSQFGASLANQLLNTGKGSSTSATGSSTGTSNSLGTSDSTATPSILSTLGSLASLLMMGSNTNWGGLTGGSGVTQGGNTGIPVTLPYSPGGAVTTPTDGYGGSGGGVYSSGVQSSNFPDPGDPQGTATSTINWGGIPGTGGESGGGGGQGDPNGGEDDRD